MSPEDRERRKQLIRERIEAASKAAVKEAEQGMALSFKCFNDELDRLYAQLEELDKGEGDSPT